ncbi:hypothetical protein JMJ55_26275 [Belnapia sp. T6]|uniref:Uncharacterized protein n=1 Tax=Belnapia mucosa TaxID=2804532 RepID=A0ABS1VEM4_9PROT|nr:hypothetical protein [Belnapia mucosa]MBL6458843.1 hypothetical protein [Belnapia mucosa]
MPIEVSDGARVCRWISGHDALEHFASYTGPTQSQQHIKPLHWYVACRLVVEGGFHPDEINPHPPFEVRQRGTERQLIFNPAKATGSEGTILGGLKTKNVDVVVTKHSLGPVMAVSCKGTIGAFRNLTNRMEEAVGDCTNLHITYPAMVCGFLSVIRANRAEEAAVGEIAPEGAPPGRQLQANDIAVQRGGDVVESVIRYHNALRELTGRRGIRDDVSRYEAVSLAMVESNSPTPGRVLPDFPAADSPLRIEQFFQALYLRYDERYVYAAPDLKHVTHRIEWAETSPALVENLSRASRPAFDFVPRLRSP